MAISNPDVIWTLDPDSTFYKFVFNPVGDYFLNDWGKNNFCWLFWRTVLTSLVSAFLLMCTITMLPMFLTVFVLAPLDLVGVVSVWPAIAAIDAFWTSISAGLSVFAALGGLLAAGLWIVIALFTFLFCAQRVIESIKNRRKAYYEEHYDEIREREFARAAARRERRRTKEKTVSVGDVLYQFYVAVKMRYCPTIEVKKLELEDAVTSD